MQAPTTPNGSTAAREPGGRSCPSCGVGNGMEAAFCWQCFRPFSAGRSGAYDPNAATGVRGGVPGTQPATLPLPQRRSATARIGAAVIAVAVVAGAGLFFLNRGSGAALPASFGGMAQVEGPDVDQAVELFDEQVEAQGFQADIALYGSNGTPAAALFWAVDGSGTSMDQAFDEFTGGFSAGLGSAGYSGVTTSSEVVGGVRYLCASMGTLSTGMCMWTRDDVFWVLIELTPSVQGPLELAVTAHDAAA